MFQLVDPLYYFALTEVCKSLFDATLIRYTLCRPDLFTADVVPILKREIASRKDVPERLKPDFDAEIERLERAMQKFCHFACNYVKDPFRFADRLAWNWEGEVDVKKTFVSAIVGSENFGLEEKFKMACAICDDDSLRLVKNSEGFDAPKAYSHSDVVYDFYFYKEDAWRDSEYFFHRAVDSGNPFAVEFFWSPRFHAHESIVRGEKTARFLFSKCRVDRRHLLVPLVLPFYRRRNRFRSFESDFWDVLDPVVKERTLSLLCGDVSTIFFDRYLDFRDCLEEEILFFAKLLTGTRQMGFLCQMWRFRYFGTKFKIEFVVRLLRACGKENARKWIDAFGKNIHPPVLFELISKNLI